MFLTNKKTPQTPHLTGESEIKGVVSQKDYIFFVFYLKSGLLRELVFFPDVPDLCSMESSSKTDLFGSV